MENKKTYSIRLMTDDEWVEMVNYRFAGKSLKDLYEIKDPKSYCKAIIERSNKRLGR